MIGPGLRLRTVNGMRIALVADKCTPCDGDTLISEEDAVAILHYRGTSWDGKPSSPARRSRVAAQSAAPCLETMVVPAPVAVSQPTLGERLDAAAAQTKGKPRPRAKRTRMRSTVERWLREGRKVRLNAWVDGDYVQGKDLDDLRDEKGYRQKLSEIWSHGGWTVVP